MNFVFAFFYLNLEYLLFLLPAILLMVWAQYRVKATYRKAMQVPARMSGAAAARYILDQAGLQHVGIEQTHGMLSDHYDPRGKVLRLSRGVYNERSAAAVGIAAHEAGHALQDATRYFPLVVRNAAVPAATWGPNIAFILLLIGFITGILELIWLGIIGYSALLVFQLVNLPVEFDASARAKRILDDYDIVDASGSAAVRKVLNAAAWTYVAATLQTLLTVLYFVLRALSRSRN